MPSVGVQVGTAYRQLVDGLAQARARGKGDRRLQPGGRPASLRIRPEGVQRERRDRELGRSDHGPVTLAEGHVQGARIGERLGHSEWIHHEADLDLVVGTDHIARTRRHERPRPAQVVGWGAHRLGYLHGRHR